MAKRNALGRGLGALIDDANQINEPKEASINEIAISKIEANPFQPRTKFDEEALKELAASIKEIGIIQPVTLRKNGNGMYQIIAGERRCRAAKIAGLKAIPAYIRETDDKEMLEMALVENIQREDLDAIEISISYQRLIEECKLTQENLSERVGKKRSTISNYLRLLKLPAIIQKAIREKEISMGHARALVNVENPEDQTKVFEQIIKHEFSVRKVEEIVRNLNAEEKPNKTTPVSKYPEEYLSLKQHLDKFFNTSVDFKIDGKGKGKIVVPFNSTNDLERIVHILDNLDL